MDLIALEGVEPSAVVRERLAGAGVPVLLAFSGGKDSIAAWLALREAGVAVLAYSLYLVPGLRFVDEQMAGFEDWFGQKIHRYPHPSLFRWLNNLVFQPPERCALIEAARLPPVSHEDVARMIRADLGMPADAWIADGVRAADSIVRRTSFLTHGVAKERTHKVSVVWDWRKQHVMDAVAGAGIELPPDYAWFGRSFDGLDIRFLGPLKEHAPEDYARVIEWFPLAELELVRRDL